MNVICLFHCSWCLLSSVNVHPYWLWRFFFGLEFTSLYSCFSLTCETNLAATLSVFHWNIDSNNCDVLFGWSWWKIDNLEPSGRLARVAISTCSPVRCLVGASSPVKTTKDYIWAENKLQSYLLVIRSTSHYTASLFFSNCKSLKCFKDKPTHFICSGKTSLSLGKTKLHPQFQSANP